MPGGVEFLTRGVLIGVGAAALMDAWALFSRRAFDIRGLDYAMLGRWIGHFPRGRFFHQRIASADPSCQSPDRGEPLVPALKGHVVGC